MSNVSEQAATLAAEIERIRRLDPDFDWTDVAVLSRNGFEHPELCAVQATLENAGLPYSRPLDWEKGFPLHRIREIDEFLNVLTGNKSELPVRSAVHFIYETLAEQRREQSLGRGVFLSTAHGANGLEFPHVFVLKPKTRATCSSNTS